MVSHSDRHSHYTTDHGEVKLLSPGLGRDDGQGLRAPEMCCADNAMVERERLPLPDTEVSRPALVSAQRFVQRWDLHARQMDDGSYVCVHEQLNVGHLFAHLRGEITLGACLLDQERQARYGIPYAPATVHAQCSPVSSLWLDAHGEASVASCNESGKQAVDFRAGLGYTRRRLDIR
jgi:hypothetical protein